MERLRLDRNDPLASVIAWLEALAQALGIGALGIDPSVVPSKLELSEAGAAVLRGWLTSWSRQLRALAAGEAVRLARGLAARLLVRPKRRRLAAALLGRAQRYPKTHEAPSGEVPSVLGSPRAALAPSKDDKSFAEKLRHGATTLRCVGGASAGAASAATRLPAGPHARPSLDILLSDDEIVVLGRRYRGVHAALEDRSALVRRLTLRLAQRLARARAALASLRGAPLGALGVLGGEKDCNAKSAKDAKAPWLAPQPRPPDLRSSAYG